VMQGVLGVPEHWPNRFVRLVGVVLVEGYVVADAMMFTCVAHKKIFL
jgi:hypothetical protein